ncbi:hypothetical protein [Aquimarina spongiae]|uniref:T9SS C-terminal target domain-containing protein n=1 Tax=Aquimarina spongiae TaxID=570521 RepID=A0A1M6E5X6_9FLAO|nr:hypothetical protein [Aquimarina spongiae]SHI80815.1 hypothetical protein SAMN04488508_103233 [Aquimarina spongiae]
MKLNALLLVLCCNVSILAWSQADIKNNHMDWTKGWTNFDPNLQDYPEAEEILPSTIETNAYLRNDVVYLMSGNVYVTNNATLTIQEGTIIRCDTKNPASLIIAKGSKLIAKGSKMFPIVFTSNEAPKSRKPGDWGGIIIAGSGKINSPAVTKVIEGNFLPQYSMYGGTGGDKMTADLDYVRIEFAGKKTNKSKELNGLSLYALGKRSSISNIMISYSADDSFECFGGSVPMSNLISYKAKDDDFDFTLGYSGELSDILAIRHPYISDISGSFAIEIDGYDKKDGFINTSSLSYIKIKNATLINLSDKSNYQHTTAAISSKNLARIELTESKISGFANVVKFDKTYQSYTDIEKCFLLENSIFNVHDIAITTGFTSNKDLGRLLKYNMYTNNFKSAEDLFTDPTDTKNPKFTIKESSNYTFMQ